MGLSIERNRKNFPPQYCYYSGIKESDLMIARAKCDIGNIPETITRGILLHVDPNECVIIANGACLYEFVSKPGEYKYEGYTDSSFIGDNLDKSVKEAFLSKKQPFDFKAGNQDREAYYFSLAKRDVQDVLFDRIPMSIQNEDGSLKEIVVHIQVGYTYQIANPVVLYEFLQGSIGEEYEFIEFESVIQKYLYTSLLTVLNDTKEKGKLNECIQSKFSMIEDTYRNIIDTVLKKMGIRMLKIVIEDSNVEGMNYHSVIPKNQDVYPVDPQIENILENSNRIVLKLDDSWTCSCGTKNTTNFCGNCGMKRPE